VGFAGIVGKAPGPFMIRYFRDARHHPRRGSVGHLPSARLNKRRSDDDAFEFVHHVFFERTPRSDNSLGCA